MDDSTIVRRIARQGTSDFRGEEEWLATNGLGGYAGGTLLGAPTRRYHGMLVAAFPAPIGLALILGPMLEQAVLVDGAAIPLGGGFAYGDADSKRVGHSLVEFRLELGLPVWTYRLGGALVEKRVLTAHHMNTVLAIYRLLEGDDALTLELTPTMPFRSYDAPVNTPPVEPLEIQSLGEHWEVKAPHAWPSVRISIAGGSAALISEGRRFLDVRFQLEDERGYEAVGDLFAPATFRMELHPARPVFFRASTEEWSSLGGNPLEDSESTERERRRRLLAASGPATQDPIVAELALAADQFLIEPVGRAEHCARIRAEGDEPRSVIAGYHWFTDWGRDTMISLEGLTLCTGRHLEAGCILRTFAHHIRDGLIPNYFPDGDNEGVYHTADASLWFFQALQCYLAVTGDLGTLRVLLPKLSEIIAAHICGTHFGIQVDPADGLLRQGDGRLPLTWMDARMGDWVVTPRRGKAVEINALWFNALSLFCRWTEAGACVAGSDLGGLIEQARSSFNRRFWNPTAECLFDVVDGEQGDDPSCRPNQLFALALEHPILDRKHWEPVLQTVRAKLLTPVGLRTLAPGHSDYKGYYRGDLRSRDGAYHQGAVWPWLLGPFIDAWLKVHPDDRAGARRWLEGLIPHLSVAGVGSIIREIFDAEPPYAPRGCVAQAWSVAETLRCWIKTMPAESDPK